MTLPPVISTGPVAAPRIGVESYPHRLAGHCGSGALRDLLEWAGLSWGADPISEGSVFGLGGALGFSYLRAEGLGTPFYLVGRTAHLTMSLSDRLGITTTPTATEDPACGWATVRTELEAGRPVLCWADMSKLPYLRVRMQMSRHDIVVTGYDPDTDHVQVIDNDRAEPQLIPAAALAAARSSTGFPEPTRHTCYPMRFPATLPDQHRATAQACAQAAAAMTDPTTTDISTASVHAGGNGLRGVAAFVEDLDTWPDTLTTSTDHPERSLNAALLTLAVFIERAGTGGGLFRRLQAEFLTDLATLTPRARPAADAFHQLAAHWTTLAALGAAETTPETARERWQTARRHARHLTRLETDATQQLADLADHLEKKPTG